ncbi:MAG: hypothetical protein L0271_15785 [Gemmatimonadetes bacterium]|nr:hypothetical protein [Gemmatimonadota bacterium]
MKRIPGLILGLSLVAGFPGAVAAQQGAGVRVAPLAGAMVFGDMVRGPLGSSLTMASGALFGAQVSAPIAGPLAVYGSGSWASSDIEIGVPFIGGLDVGDADVLFADAGLELRANTGHARPFLQLGAGLAHYSVRHPMLDIDSDNLILVGGAGVDIPVLPALGLRILVRDHVGAPDLREALLIPVEARTSHNLSLSLGLAFGF